jgi:hypothetical protein
MFDFCQYLAKVAAPVYTLACLFEGGRISEFEDIQSRVGFSRDDGSAV